MSEADILAATYYDKVTVYRPQKTRNEAGETVFLEKKNGEVVYRNKPCALSSHSGGRHQRSGTAPEAGADYKLFTRPELEIRPGDYLEVTQRDRVSYMTAGLPARLPSHNEVPVHPEEGFV